MMSQLGLVWGGPGGGGGVVGAGVEAGVAAGAAGAAGGVATVSHKHVSNKLNTSVLMQLLTRLQAAATCQLSSSAEQVAMHEKVKSTAETLQDVAHAH